ncbi:hypothetical protein [Gibbsiella quercinecans]|uniref:hypothetical protein n=1 Tax=Gibbsiella quercinecans TaxID=929813 RepID=UPI00242C03C7|nr:hypothetical protein [Gibbsiella quercinecans]
MGRSTTRKLSARKGGIRSKLLAQVQYGKMYLAMKLRRARIPAPLMALFGAMLSILILGLLIASVVAIDIMTTLFLLCRKLLGRSHKAGALMPRG